MKKKNNLQSVRHSLHYSEIRSEHFAHLITFTGDTDT